MSLRIERGQQYKKDSKKLTKRRKRMLRDLEFKLSTGFKLTKKYDDHELKYEWEGV